MPILVNQPSARQTYVFELVFRELIGISYHTLTAPPTQKHLSYGAKPNDFYVAKHGILDQTDIQKQPLSYVFFESFEVPFKIKDKQSMFEFDPFALIFYTLTRYEEYLPSPPDAHGRFKATDSWQSQKGCLTIPIVNFLAQAIKGKIEAHWGIKIKDLERAYVVEPTLDIDNAYAFFNRKGGMAKSLLKSALTLDFQNLKLKSVALREAAKDPYNTHHQIMELVREFEQSRVFFLMRSGGLNSTNEVPAKAQQDLIKLYQREMKVGIHPAYNTFKNTQMLKDELKTLENILGQEVQHARFHYIQSVLPMAYQQLLAAGITHDYSMGYATESGFRAGICVPFMWFDLAHNGVTELEVHPFCFMDASYVFHQKIKPEEALLEVELLAYQVKKYKGVMSFVFHNESLSGYDVYKGWQDFVPKTLEVVK